MSIPSRPLLPKRPRWPAGRPSTSSSRLASSTRQSFQASFQQQLVQTPSESPYVSVSSLVSFIRAIDTVMSVTASSPPGLAHRLHNLASPPVTTTIPHLPSSWSLTATPLPPTLGPAAHFVAAILSKPSSPFISPASLVVESLAILSTSPVPRSTYTLAVDFGVYFFPPSADDKERASNLHPLSVKEPMSTDRDGVRRRCCSSDATLDCLRTMSHQSGTSFGLAITLLPKSPETSMTWGVAEARPQATSRSESKTGVAGTCGISEALDKDASGRASTVGGWNVLR
ncbi:hypothetical protein R3P38DRAFT_3170345 [Favolaschia claudopus]|uniref:Uncharacterized protein n=1 Tax=Favolaschia claudopus TaxID=2862362 RepID=A0AAW0DX15_9AGAR